MRGPFGGRRAPTGGDGGPLRPVRSVRSTDSNVGWSVETLLFAAPFFDRADRYGAAVPEPLRLPRADEAAVPREKLAGYALDPSHSRGRHKARVFASALAVHTKDWRFLRDQILAALPSSPVRTTRITPFGVAYEVVVMIDGLNGATAPVVTTWLIEGNAPPRLTSTWVDIP
jgi:hypothetical protein